MSLCRIPVIAATALFAVLPMSVLAEDATLVIQDHRFQPEVLQIPAQQRVKLLIENRDATPEEFDSHDLHREKVIAGNSQAIVWVGPLEPGEYGFVGEFHEDTARGKLIVE